MEERPPPSKFHTLHLPSPSSRETYVVQYPRDQIHRVPPPEHARIIEEHFRISSDPSRHARRRNVILIAGGVLILGILFAVIMSILRATAYNPEAPEFSVAGIQAKNLDVNATRGRRPPPSPVFTVALRARSPNPRMHAAYAGGREATLSFNEYRIGRGKMPPEKGADVNFGVTMTGNPPVAIKKLLTGAAAKAMVLTAEVPVEMTSWARNQKWDLKLSCQFTVKGSLTSKTIKIASQDCQTES
ncbi:NDR1/HIN1-like protein 13 [Andrographis paniculata]|uniref:NDR1/HIN1-like protein 13 n=1 Tax=Andrographis paniculata TaxID=175694 RepID=UPI0021E94484|nr:NDR1/HIN1-like protein 13 [Andrographis paniculata]